MTSTFSEGYQVGDLQDSLSRVIFTAKLHHGYNAGQNYRIISTVEWLIFVQKKNKSHGKVI